MGGIDPSSQGSQDRTDPTVWDEGSMLCPYPKGIKFTALPAA